MTAINNLPNYSGYYQLSKHSGGGIAQPNGTGSLLQALSSTSGSTSNNDAYFLDLSPQARQYLEGVNSGQINNNPVGSKTGFLLTQEQQKAISDIVSQYKNAPFTQETFNAIQNDLEAANLDPETLARLESAKLYSPTAVLIKALNDDDTVSEQTNGVMSDADKTAKTDYFMQQIVSQWKNLGEQPEEASSDGESGVAPVGSAGGA